MPVHRAPVVGLGALLFAVAVVGACRTAPNLPPGERTCVGFPPDVCRRQVDELQDEAEAHGGVLAYRIVCTRVPCTSERGDGTIAVVFADGSGREGGFGYAVPVGTPPEATKGPLPVQPACLGVAADWCEDLARTGAEQVPDWSTIRSITVRCSGACTARSGQGETIVERRDGPPTTLSWEYQTGE